MKEKYITSIKTVMGLGSAKSGTSHWKWQRISALGLVFLYSWFIYMVFNFFESPEFTINEVLYSPFQLICFILMINFSIYHGILGMRVIFEDYVHNEFMLCTCIISTYFIAVFSMCAVTLSLVINFTTNV